MDERRTIHREGHTFVVYTGEGPVPTSHHDTLDDAMARALTSVRCSGGGVVDARDESGRVTERIEITADGVERELEIAR